MAEQERQEHTNYIQADASGTSAAQDMSQSQPQQLPPQQQQQQQQQQPQSQSQSQQAAGPLLPPIQQTTGQPAQPVPGHDQSQGPMQPPSPQHGYAMQQQNQQQHQQQHNPPPPQQQPQYGHAQPPTAPQQQQQQPQPPPPPPAHAQSPVVTPQPQYAQSPQQHYEQPPQQQQQQQQQQHYEQHPPQAHYAQPALTQPQQAPQVQYELPPPPQANGAPPGYAPAQQHIPPHHSAYQYQQQQQQQPPPPPQPQPQYQPPMANGDPNGYPSQMRYPMPLPAGQMNAQQLSGARHKKEIKRRTKTGCLTCRKRRIKCDEGHPSCRNCQKSKRECLGYDPIFKAQTGQPANIQPQPGSVPPPPASHSPHLPPPPPPHAQYSNVPQGYAPASSAGYAPASVIQTQLEQAAYEYGGAIDPALAAAHPPPAHAPPPMPPAQEEYTTILLPERKVRVIAMDDVFSLDAIQPTFPAPRDPNSPMPQQDIDPIRDLYMREYAPGLDRFFETDWYSAAGLHILLASPDLLHYFAHCLHRFHVPPSESNKGLPSIEARLVWLLASMAFSPQASANNAPPLPFIPRIEAVSHLILGTFMQPESVPPAPAHMPDMKTQPEAYAFYLQDLFWHHLASLTTVHDDVISQAATNDIASHLAGMRNILSMLENRDVLYSMAIARHFGGRMERFEPDKLLVGRGGEVEDPINKLAVAMSFLANEEVGGTTQVVQRVCGMGRRGFALQRLDFGMSSQNESKDEAFHDAVDCTTMSFEDHQHQHQHHQQEQDQPQHNVQPHDNGNGDAKFEHAPA